MTTTVKVTDLAEGIWRDRVGTTLDLVAAGANARHVLVRVPGERKVFGFPASWLDGLPTDAPQPECGAAATEAVTEPPLRIEPPQSLEEFVFDYVNEREPDLVFAAIAEWERLQEVAP